MTELRRAKVYRNVELRQEWLGLEPLDAVGLGGLAWLLMLLNRSGPLWNFLVVVLAFVGLRLGKRRKPPGYTSALVRFTFRRPFFSAAAPDLESADHPFPIAHGDHDRAPDGAQGDLR